VNCESRSGLVRGRERERDRRENNSVATDVLSRRKEPNWEKKAESIFP
jgi:hypothetical protein